MQEVDVEHWLNGPKKYSYREQKSDFYCFHLLYRFTVIIIFTIMTYSLSHTWIFFFYYKAFFRDKSTYYNIWEKI